MFSVTTLEPTAREFVTGALINSGRSRSKLVTICLGKALADRLDVCDMSPDEDIKIHFRRDHELEVMNFVSTINELAVIDVDNVITYAREFYLWRAMISRGGDIVLCTDPRQLVLNMFSIDHVLDPDALALMEADHIGVMKYYNGFKKLLEELAVYCCKAD